MPVAVCLITMGFQLFKCLLLYLATFNHSVTKNGNALFRGEEFLQLCLSKNLFLAKETAEFRTKFERGITKGFLSATFDEENDDYFSK